MLRIMFKLAGPSRRRNPEHGLVTQKLRFRNSALQRKLQAESVAGHGLIGTDIEDFGGLEVFRLSFPKFVPSSLVPQHSRKSPLKHACPDLLSVAVPC